jgi:hypothetical protein
VTARSVAFLATLAAVVLLLGSLVLGMRESTAHIDLGPLGQPTPELPRERIRVEVLNASSVAGLAREVTQRLRSAGFDVVYYGNAGRMTRDSSVVVDRIGNADAAARVAAALGVDRIETAIDTTLYLDATVILAPDFSP